MGRWKLQQCAFFYTVLLGVLTLVGDYLTGPYIQFPILFVLPVLLAAWYRSFLFGIAPAMILPILRLGLAWHWDATTPWTMFEPTVNTLVRIVVLGVIAYMTARASQEKQSLQKEIRILRGLLPICMHCKKIRDAQDEWKSLELYIMKHSEATFTHGICPSCMEERYGHYLSR